MNHNFILNPRQVRVNRLSNRQYQFVLNNKRNSIIHNRGSFGNERFANLWSPDLIGNSFFHNPPKAKLSDISFRILRVKVRDFNTQLVMRIILDKDSPKPPPVLLVPTITVFNDRRIQFEQETIQVGPNTFIEASTFVFQPGIDNFPR